MRVFSDASLGDSSTSPWTFTIYSTVSPEITEENAEIEPGSVVITVGSIVFTDQGNGTLTSPTAGNSGVINYISSSVTLTTTATTGTAATITFGYFPGLPVMGIRTQELNSSVVNATIFFDTTYAYIYDTTTFIELPSTTETTWTGNDADFFWSTNYWVDSSTPPNKLFWVTNASGTSGDPIRYYNNITWTDFGPTASPQTGQIDNASPNPNFVTQCLCMLPYRGRLVFFNTLEGISLAASTQYFQRIRWSAIGNPLTTTAWRDDIRGQGGFLDIPTSENITAVGFVRDNLVIYCERSTWQLRYTGRSIAPFQIERVNSELGSYSTFSAVQFDTSLVGIGDKGIVQCDSYKSERIDIKIPDLVFNFSSENAAPERIQGIRDIQQRVAYWTYVYSPTEEEEIAQGGTGIYPNRRLVYNYENDSWAIYTDSLTALGNFQTQSALTWEDSDFTWDEADFTWNTAPTSFPALVGGNQQGFVMYLGSNLTPQVSNDITLSITNIAGNGSNPTVITSPNHNLVSGEVISISDIPIGTPFSDLNDPGIGNITASTNADPCEITSPDHGLKTGDLIEIDNVGGMTELNGNLYTVTVIDANDFTIDVDSTSFDAYTSGGTWTNQSTTAFGIVVLDENTFQLWIYNPVDGEFSIPQTDPSGQTYVGGGKISVRNNFEVLSKKFNFLDAGQNIQMGYIDMLLEATESGAITMNVYLNYNESNPVNVLPENIDPSTDLPDPFFNSTIPTSQSELGGITGSKYWQRVYCAVRGAFVTVKFTLSNAQLVGVEQESEVEISSQILWLRQAGRLETW
jgi:Ubiquitin-activating enzyme E1 FCCH domain